MGAMPRTQSLIMLSCLFNTSSSHYKATY